MFEKYPFLKYYDTEYSWLDEFDPGWKTAFGEDFCKELKEALIKDDCLDKFGFDQIKEKFAALRIYAHGYGPNAKDVIAKYEILSCYICGHCGKPARHVTKGYMYPICEECARDIQSPHTPIEEFYGFEKYKDVEKEVKEIKSNFQYEKYWKKI